MAALRLDRGLWATWRGRGLTPPPLPTAWFRPARGYPLTYRLDHIRAWIATRRGEPYDGIADWQDCLRTTFWAEISDPVEVRKHAAIYARAVGPVVGDVRFTSAGFAAYLASL